MATVSRRVLFISALLSLLLSSQAYALTGVTKDGFMFCMTEGWLEDLGSFMAEEDNESIREYVADKSCAMLKGGMNVKIIRSTGFFDTRIEFEYKGLRLWTFREAIKIDKKTKKKKDAKAD